MIEKLPIFIANHPILVFMALVALACALLLELRKGGSAISVMQLTSMMNKSQVTVVDIRSEKDFKTGHINESINIPSDKILNQTAVLNKAEKTPVLVCATGMQCRAFIEKLEEIGIKATRLAGGINEWSAAKIPLTK